ncbi:MAG: hypothetical protein H6739_07150 [Alphaproteobacteria bacterium]|nr:hypothetical protein [Alphaproteobacteria bacterium]
MPVVSTPLITEEGFGQGRGDGVLHLGGELNAAYALTERWLLMALVGTRRSYMGWESVENDGPAPSIQTRTMRIQVGMKRSFTEPPTFPFLSASAGLCSSWWGLQYGTLEGDRISRGPGVAIGAGVDHFLSRRVAVSGELRGWAELHGAEAIAIDGWRFESRYYRVGGSLLVGFTFN